MALCVPLNLPLHTRVFRKNTSKRAYLLLAEQPVGTVGRAVARRTVGGYWHSGRATGVNRGSKTNKKTDTPNVRTGNENETTVNNRQRLLTTHDTQGMLHTHTQHALTSSHCSSVDPLFGLKFRSTC